MSVFWILIASDVLEMWAFALGYFFMLGYDMLIVITCMRYLQTLKKDSK